MINLPVGSVASETHLHLRVEECICIIERTDVSRIWPELSQVEAEDLICHPHGDEAHDLRDIGPSHKIFTGITQLLAFNIGDCLEQNKRMYWHVGQLPDFVDIATD